MDQIKKIRNYSFAVSIVYILVFYVGRWNVFVYNFLTTKIQLFSDLLGWYNREEIT